MEADYNYWAKKFDKVKHIYANGGANGTLCGSVSACLGNNYSTKEMPVCPECLKIQNSHNKVADDCFDEIMDILSSGQGPQSFSDYAEEAIGKEVIKLNQVDKDKVWKRYINRINDEPEAMQEGELSGMAKIFGKKTPRIVTED